MTGPQDVVVIGGGVIGSSTAFHLARLGAGRVTLLERGAIASGASGRSGALVRMHYTSPHEARMALAALPWFEEWGERVGGDCGFTRTGFLQLVAPDDADRLRANVAMLREVGVDTQVVTPDEVRRLAPAMQFGDDELAAYEPRGGYADPTRTAQGFAGAAAGLGVTVMEGVEALAIEAAGGRISGVRTAAGSIPASAVVVANGNWSLPLLRPLGLEPALRPIRAQVAFFERPPELPRGAGAYVTVIDRRYGYYSRPNGDGETLIGLSGFHRPEPDLDELARDNDPGFAPLALEQLAKRVPAFGGARYLRGHKGPLDVTEDGRAILGAAPGVEGLYLAIGMSGTGFKKSPAIGSCMAELVESGTTVTAPIHPFRPTRFAEGDPITGAEYSLPEEAVDSRELGELRGRGLIH